MEPIVSFMTDEMFEVDGIYYYINKTDNTCCIVKCGTSEAILRLPEYAMIEGESYTVVSIEERAFLGNSDIRELIVPDCYKCIENFSFELCGNLKKVYIGSGVICFGPWAFMDSPVETVTISENNPYIKMSDDGRSILSKDGRKFRFHFFREDEKIVVQNGVEIIDLFSISDMSNLKEIYFPLSLKEMGRRSIHNCNPTLTMYFGK